MATNKEKVDIKRSDQFQEVDEELTRAMAELDSTIERVSLIFQSDSDLPGMDDDPEAVVADASEAVGEADEPPVQEKQAGRAKSEQ
jgi:hypothetical protein